MARRAPCRRSVAPASARRRGPAAGRAGPRPVASRWDRRARTRASAAPSRALQAPTAERRGVRTAPLAASTWPPAPPVPTAAATRAPRGCARLRCPVRCQARESRPRALRPATRARTTPIAAAASASPGGASFSMPAASPARSARSTPTAARRSASRTPAALATAGRSRCARAATACRARARSARRALRPWTAAPEAASPGATPPSGAPRRAAAARSARSAPTTARVARASARPVRTASRAASPSACAAPTGRSAGETPTAAPAGPARARRRVRRASSDAGALPRRAAPRGWRARSPMPAARVLASLPARVSRARVRA
jgi:ribonuclease E